MIIDDNFLTDNNKKFIHHITNTNKFPYYLSSKTTTNDPNKTEMFTHSIIQRPNQRRNPNGYDTSKEYGDNVMDFLKQFTDKHQIRYNEVLRACINLTIHNNQAACSVHQDHDFPHHQLLIYLNDPSCKESRTVILDDSNNKTVEVYPKQYRGVFFPSCPHYHYFPKHGTRIVAIFTFR